MAQKLLLTLATLLLPGQVLGLRRAQNRRLGLSPQVGGEPRCKTRERKPIAIARVASPSELRSKISFLTLSTDVFLALVALWTVLPRICPTLQLHPRLHSSPAAQTSSGPRRSRKEGLESYKNLFTVTFLLP